MKHITFTLAILTAFACGKTAVYDLTIAGELVDITGRKATGMTINGGIPSTTLRFTRGDKYEVGAGFTFKFQSHDFAKELA
jgi:hypothetical protein